VLLDKGFGETYIPALLIRRRLVSWAGCICVCPDRSGVSSHARGKAGSGGIQESGLF